MKQLLQAAAAQLSAVAETPRAEAEWLLAQVLGCSRVQVQAGVVEPPDAAQSARFTALLASRATGLPFAYVTGEQPFRSLSVAVTPDVLIPRPETEQLVDWALALLPAREAPVLDVCTGSGCIAIALATEAAHARVWASELSPAALALARRNAAKAGARVHFLEADGLALPTGTPQFQLIVGNPPYIAEGDAHLPALQHEPALALVSGPDGLSLIRRLVADAPQWLLPGGWLLLEHGYDQSEAVQALMTAAGFVAVQSHRDYGGQWRATQGQRPL